MLLSRLIELYIDSNERRCEFRRNECMYLSEWAEEMLSAGYDLPALREAAEGFDMTQPEQAKACLEEVVKELLHTSEINADLAFNISVEEYRRGEYGSAAEFLYYKKYVAEKLGFPYTVDYDGAYFAAEKRDFRGEEFEEYSEEFLISELKSGDKI